MAIGRFRDAKQLAPTQIRSRLADEVRTKRNQMGQSQEAFAKECSIALRTYKRFEAGQCDSLAVFIKVLKVFGRFDAFELMFEEAVPTTQPRTALALARRAEAKAKARSSKQTKSALSTS